jgi:hypothetical protein
MLSLLQDGRYLCTRCTRTLQTGVDISGKQLGDLIKLCHPDRYEGSPLKTLATDTTRWLLTLRAKAKGKAQ